VGRGITREKGNYLLESLMVVVQLSGVFTESYRLGPVGLRKRGLGHRGTCLEEKL
jgi:hypothetical protein